MPYGTILGPGVADMARDTWFYLKNNLDRAIVHLLVSFLLLGILLYFFFLDKRGRLFVHRDSKVIGSISFVTKPICATILLSLFSIIFIYKGRPLVMGQLAMIIAMLPMLLILRGMVNRRFMPYIYLIGLLFVLIFIVKNTSEKFGVVNRMVFVAVDAILLH